MTDFVKQLKEQINIAEIVGEYVRLKKTGSNHMGLCPFHGERTPSFSVAERKGIFHCFGCQRSGDAISFVQEIQGISFHEAVRFLASKAGMKVPPEFAARGKFAKNSAGAEDKLEIYYKLNRFVAQFYHEKLMSPSGEGAREYLRRRGITDATIKSSYLGYAPADWAELYEFLKEKKAPLDKAEELGLVRRKNAPDATGRTHYDLFRDRVMFPVIDLRGRVIAFGARALGDTDGPKYLNSTESPVFKKGSYLFGLFQAQKDIRAEDMTVVVEGFMDCLSLQQAGIGYTVATLGTALTPRQVALLKRFTRNIVIVFDGDAAGKEAQARAMETFLEEDVVVRGVTLPDECDPDEFVQERGVEALAAMLKSAPFILDQRILELAAQAGGHAEARARAVDQALPWIARVGSDTARIVRLQELSNLFGIDYSALARRVEDLRRQIKPSSSRTSGRFGSQSPQPQRPVFRPAQQVAGPRSEELDGLDSRLIEKLIRFPKLVDEISDKNGILNGLETELTRDTVTKLLAAESALDITSDLLDSTSAALKKVLARALVLAEQEQGAQHTPEQQELHVRELKDLERKLIRRGLERRKESLRAALLKLEGSGQSEELSRLMSEYHELVRRLDETRGGQVNL